MKTSSNRFWFLFLSTAWILAHGPFGQALGQAPTISWTGAASAEWGLPSNWNPQRIPNAADVVEIATGTNVQLNVSASIASLRLGQTSGIATQTLMLNIGQTLTLGTNSTINSRGVLVLSAGQIGGPGLMAIDGRFDWMGDRITSRLLVQPSGALKLSGISAKQLYSDDPSFPAALTNRGLVSWNTAQPLTLGNATRVINGPGGIWRLEADGSPFNNAGGPQSVFLNQGTLIKAAGTNSAVIDASVLFTNQGTVVAQSSPFIFTGVGDFASGGRLDGPFPIRLEGVATFVGTTLNTVVELVSGTLSGNVTLAGNGPVFNWSGGRITGSLTVPSGGVLNLTGLAAKHLFSDDPSFPAALTNRGLVSWNTAQPLTLGNATRLINGPGGTWRLEADGSPFNNAGGPQSFFLNQGTLIKAAGTNDAVIDSSLLFTNQAIIVAQSSPFLFTGASHFGNGSQLNGPYPITFEGSITVSGPLQLNTVLELNSGTLAGDVTFTGSTRVMNWSGGRVTRSLTIPSGGALNLVGPATRQLYSDDPGFPAAVTNLGLVTWQSTPPITVGNATRLVNLGNWRMEVDGSPFNNAGGPQSSFLNQGILAKAATGGTVTINSLAFRNQGTLAVPMGRLELPAGQDFGANSRVSVNISGSGALTNYGQLEVVGAGTLRGTLAVTLVNGFVPSTGDRFTIVTGTPLNGSLTTEPLPSLPAGRAWALNQTPTALILSVETAGDCTPRASGLAMWFRGESNALDVVGGFHADTNNGVSYAPGRVGQAFRFDGVNDYLSVPDPQAGRFTNLTIEAWVQFARPGLHVLVGKTVGSGGFNSYVLWMDNQTLNAVIGDASSFSHVSAPLPVELGRWYHLAFTFDDAANTLQLFTNGVRAASVAAPQSIAYDSHPLLIGAEIENEGFGGFSHAAIDEVSLYNRALTSNELAAIVASGVTGKCTNDLPANPGPPTPPCAAPPPGLFVWLPAEGSAADVMGNHHGALMNGVGFVPGKVGQAFRFDGVDDYVNLGPWFTNQVFSFAMWVKEGESQVTYADIFDNNHTCCRTFVFQYENTGHRFQFGDNSVGSISFNLAPGVWHHVVVTRDAGYILRGYLDGQLLGSITNNGAPVIYDGTQYLRLSAWGGGGRHWEGLLDEFQIYNRGLSSNEVQALYAAGAAGTCEINIANAPNLLRNPGAEEGPALDGAPVTQIPGWTRDTNFTVVRYGAPDFPSLAESQRIRGGSNFFHGGLAAASRAWQIIDLSSRGAEVDAGQLMAMLSGHLGGYQSQGDSATVTAHFRGGSSNVLGTLSIGPVNGTGNQLLFRSNSVAVPPGTRSVLVEMVAVRVEGTSNDGMFDNLAFGVFSVSGATPDCQPVPRGLVGWWPGENAQNELISGDPALLLNGAGFAQGFVGQAFALDGGDDLISIGNLPQLQAATELTLAAWVLKASADSRIGGILGKWDSGPNLVENSFLLFNGEESYVNRGGFALQFTNGTRAQVQGTTLLPVGTWIHLAATWSSSNGQMRLYKDGVVESSITAGLGQVLQYHTAFTAKIGEWGKNNRSNSRWDGLIDEPMIFNRALSSNEIAAIAASGPAGMCRTSAPTTTITLVTTSTDWRESTTNDTSNADANPWPGAAFLPDATTFTLIPTDGAGHVYSVPGATTLVGLSGVRFFRSTFDLPSFEALTADISASFDNDLHIFINGQELALEGNLSANFSPPNHRLFIHRNGTVVNGYEGGQDFSTRAAANFPPSFFRAGSNEIVLALRNLNGGDGGGVAFRADFELTGAGTIVPSLGSRADYRFDNSLVSSVAGAPPLTNFAAGNSFVQTNVGGTPRTVFRFGANTGLGLSPADSVGLTGPYTVVALFAFDQVSGYRRILDFKNRTTDEGLYVLNGDLIFYSATSGSGAPIPAGAFVQVVLTRDSTNLVAGYVNGIKQFEFIDAGGRAALTTNSLLSFFRDDGSETSAGSVARIRVFDRALTASEVAALDRLPGEVSTRLVDLSVSNVSAPASALMGQSVQVVYTIQNNGNATVFGPWLNEFRIATNASGGGAQSIGTVPFTSELAPGASLTVTQSVILPGGVSGTRYLGVAVDSIGAIPEQNETNNTAFASVAITINAADLAGGFVSAPSSAPFGQTISVVYSVTNRGTAASSATPTDQIFFSAFSNSLSGATFLNSTNGAPLNTGASYTRTQNVQLPLITGQAAGAYYLITVVDATGAQAESNEENNLFAHAISVNYPPLPDLAVTRVTAPATATPGSDITISWAVTNRGTLMATGQWSELISISNPIFGIRSLAEFRSTNQLAAGQQAARTQTITLSPDLPAGDWLFSVRADSRFDVFESDESNNVLAATNATQIVPKLTLAAPAAELLEGTSFTATVSRNGDLTLPLTVTLTNSHSTELSFSNQVVIPSGQQNATFTVEALPDGIVDGPQLVSIGAIAAGYQGGVVSVTVVDVDVPRLRLVAGALTVVEGSTVSMTVSRDYATNLPLVVTVKGFDSAQLLVPALVTIPSNQLSVTFSVMAVDDDLIEPARSYSVEVSAAGFQTAITNVTILDNDLPNLTLTIAATNISEGAGPQATTATVIRNPASARALTVDLSNSETNSVFIPPNVTIPPGASSVSFPIGVIDNSIVDGPRTATLRAYVRDSFGAVIGPGAAASLTVLDDDGPTLKLVISRDLVPEGLDPAATAVLSRNTATNAALTVTLVSSDTRELVVPASITIPAGAALVVFNLVTPFDNVTDGNKNVTVVASAAGFTSGSDVIVVSDIDLPDFVVANVSAPTNGFTGGNFTVTYRVENRGIAASTTPFVTRVLLSTDPFTSAEDTVLGDFPFQGTLPVGLFIEQTSQFQLPATAGRYWVIIVADAANQVAEGLENNNSFAASRPLNVSAAYTATAQTDVTNAPMGAVIPLSGTAVRAGSGIPAVGVPVNVHIGHRGTRRIISVQTDINGNFTTTFTPLAGESGFYELSATHPGVLEPATQDTFRLIGLRATPGGVSLKVTEQSSVTGQLSLENLSEIPLTQLAVTVLDKPDVLTVITGLGTNTVLSSSNTVPLGYAITASQSSSRLNGTMRLRITSAEGALLDIPIQITVEPLRPRLVAYPSELQRSPLRGRQTFVEFEIVNEGGIESGPLQISTPPLAWLSVVSTNPLASLAPGQTNHVTLLLAPPADAPLTEFTGNLAINGTNGGLQIPIRFRTVSTALADLRVIAEDEFTYFAEGAPRVTNAVVSVSDSLTHTRITNGPATARGEFILSRLPEGYYDIEVKAEKHEPYKQTILLTVDRTNEVRAFLSLQLVTYNWTVTPVQTEDRYRITLETTFEANVPAPVVTLSPASLDLATLRFINGVAQVGYVLENHGLIAADAGQLQLPVMDEYEFTALVTNIGRIPAKSSFIVPVQIKRKQGIIETLTGPVIASDAAELVDYVPPIPVVVAPSPADAGLLITNTPSNGSLANSQAVLYRVQVPAGETLEVSLDSAASLGTNDVYVRFGSAPTQGEFDFSTMESTSPDARLVVPTTQAGTYYVLIHSRNMPASPASYSLRARLLPFSVTRTSSRVLGNSGVATLRVEGARFGSFTRMVLIGNGQTNFPTAFRVLDSAAVIMSFDLRGKSAGSYDLYAISVREAARATPDRDDILISEEIAAEVLLPGWIQVVANQPGALAATVILPDQIQFGREFPFQVVFTNRGATDLLTPLVRIDGGNRVALKTEPGTLLDDPTALVVGVLGKTRWNALVPGEAVRLTLYGQVHPGMGGYIEVQDLSNVSGPIDWNQYEAYYRALSSSDSWDQTWQTLIQRSGNTLSGLRAALQLAVANVASAKTVPADTLLLRLMEPSLATPGDYLVSSGSSPARASVFASRQGVKSLSSSASSAELPEDCAKWRNQNFLAADILRAAKPLVRRTLHKALSFLYGEEVAGAWDIFQDYDFETNPVPPNRLFFTDGSEFVEGYKGKPGFKTSYVTEQAARNFMTNVTHAILNKLKNCKLDCHNLPPSLTLEELFKDEPDKGAKALASFTESMDYHFDEAGIPSNTAGGRSGSFRGTKDEGRLLKQSRFHLKPVRSSCGNLKALNIEADLMIQYDDSLDFCPGGLAECYNWAAGNKLLETSATAVLSALTTEIIHTTFCLPRAASVVLQIMESYEIAYSVPFTVTFKFPTKDTISLQSKRNLGICPQKCCPAKVGMDYSYQCGGNQVAKQAESQVNNSQCKEGSEGVPDCQATGAGFSGLPPFSRGGDAGESGGSSSGNEHVFLTEAPCTPPGAAQIATVKSKSISQVPKEVCARVKLKLDQDLVTTRDAFEAALEIINNTPGALDGINVQIVVRNEQGEDATELFGIRPPVLEGVSGVNGSGSVAGNATGKAKWILIPTIDAATNGPTKYYVSGSFSYTLNGLRITVPLAPAPITALPAASLVLKYFHERDVFADDPYTLPIEPSVPFSLAILIQNDGKGTANNLRITSGQPKIVENEKGLLIDFRVIGTEVAGQPQSPSLTANFGSIAPGKTSIARWLLSSSLQGLFIDYKATFEHLDAIGNKRLSIIDHVEIHEMIHLVQAPGALEDGLPDFLVNDVPDPDDLPDTIHLSNGRTNTVRTVLIATDDGPPTASDLTVNLTAAMPLGWAYLRVPDPGNGAFRLTRVTRSDGVVIYLGTNVWTTDRTFIGQGKRPITENRLHLLDYDSAGRYILDYTPLPPIDAAAPSSFVMVLPLNSYSQFPVQWTGADDNKDGGIAFFDVFVSIDGGPFIPWLQRTAFTSSIYQGSPGHIYAFYSVAVDSAGNRELAPLAPDAQTTTTLNNTRPTLTLPANVSIDEGQTLSLTPTAVDSDLGQTLTFALLPGAPPGVVLNSANGLLTWNATEGNGPSTNTIGVVVSDNGQPSLSATSVVVVVVNEVNSAPALAFIPSRTISELQTLTFRLIAADVDLPANTLAYGFATPPPFGATLASDTGVFAWTPNTQQGPSTNRINVYVRDNGIPSMGATQTFTVIVRDSRADFGVSFGSTNLFAGQSGKVPFYLQSGLDLTNVSLVLELGASGLTNLTLAPASASVGSVSLSPSGVNRFQLRLVASSGNVLEGAGEFAQLAFDTSTNWPSALVYLRPLDVSGLRATGQTVPGDGASGRVIVINREPVLLGQSGAGQTVELFGRPGASYMVQYSSDINGPWLPIRRAILIEAMSTRISFPSNAPTAFYRAFESSPPGVPILEVRLNGGRLDFVLVGLSGTTYRIQSASALAGPWTEEFSVTLGSSSQSFSRTNSGQAVKFYRAFKP